jgi:transcriptional regulator with XRE-family HTH domain
MATAVDSPIIDSCPKPIDPRELTEVFVRLSAEMKAGELSARARKLLEDGERLRAEMRAEGLSLRAIAAKHGRSRSFVERALALAELDDPIRELLLRGELAPSTAAEIARHHDPDRRRELAWLAADGTLRRQDVIERVRGEYLRGEQHAGEPRDGPSDDHRRRQATPKNPFKVDGLRPLDGSTISEKLGLYMAKRGLPASLITEHARITLGCARSVLRGESARIFTEQASRLVSRFGLRWCRRQVGRAVDREMECTTHPLGELAGCLHAEFLRRHLSSSQLSRLAGINAATIRRYFDGLRDIRLGEAEKIAEALWIDLELNQMEAYSAIATIVGRHPGFRGIWRRPEPAEGLPSPSRGPTSEGPREMPRAVRPGPGRSFFVGEDLHELSPRRYWVLKALHDASPRTLSAPRLREASGVPHAVREVWRLKSDPVWEPRLIFPGTKGKGGYGLRLE